MAIRAVDMPLGPVAARPASRVDLEHDRRLVLRYQAGDQQAFDDLYRRHVDRLRAFCRRRVGSQHEAEEIAQEAFVKALGALPRFGGDMRFYPWLTVIASRLCVDHHRRAARTEPSDTIDLAAVDDDADARLVHADDLANLDRALARLGPRHRAVLELREGCGLSYNEIADRLGVPHSTVEARLHRARKALRQEFAAVEGRLVALPAVGWVVRRLNPFRLRVADRLPELSQLTPVAAGVLAAALAFVPGSGGHGDAQPGAGRPATAAAPAVATRGAAPEAAPAAAPARAPAASAPPDTPTTPAAPRPAPPPRARPTAALGGARVAVGSPHARQRADAMEERLEVADVIVGLNPKHVSAHLRGVVVDLGELR